MVVGPPPWEVLITPLGEVENKPFASITGCSANRNQRVIDVPYGSEQVRSRMHRVEVEGQRCAGRDADSVEQIHRIVRIGGNGVRDRLELNHPDPRAGQGRIRIHEYSEHDVVVRIDPEYHAIAKGRVGKWGELVWVVP